MKRIIIIATILIFGLTTLASAAGVETRGDGETYGPAQAVIASGDSPDGLAVHSSPSDRSRIIKNLGIGQEVKTSVRFSKGWTKLSEPVSGWVKYDYLEAKPGSGKVVDVDKPEECLRVREAPNTHSRIIGCAELGEKLQLTGLWTEDNWARVSAPADGWVWAKQITSAMKPGQEQTQVADEPESKKYKPRKRARRPEPKPQRESSLFYSEEFFEGRPKREYRGPIPKHHGPAVRISPYIGYGGRNWGVTVGPGGIGGGARFGSFGVGIGF